MHMVYMYIYKYTHNITMFLPINSIIRIIIVIHYVKARLFSY